MQVQHSMHGVVGLATGGVCTESQRNVPCLVLAADVQGVALVTNYAVIALVFCYKG